jgi:hypothetical protein
VVYHDRGIGIAGDQTLGLIEPSQAQQVDW